MVFPNSMGTSIFLHSIYQIGKIPVFHIAGLIIEPLEFGGHLIPYHP